MLYQQQSPGDIVVLSAAIRDLHKAYPGMFITGIDCSARELFDNNPYITKFNRKADDVYHIHCSYTDSVNTSCTSNDHFIRAFHRDFEDKLGLRIPLTVGKGDIHFSPEEKVWKSRVEEILDVGRSYWIIDAGRKSDFTTKLWDVQRFQQIVDAFPNVTFVQIGSAAKDHYHPPLTGDNLINEVGKTNIRQFVRLMYHAAGVITPVSFPMHLSAAVPVHPKYAFKNRPCIVIAGAREPSAWEAYSTHSYFHNCGILPCAGKGGCWKARVERLGDGDKKDKDLCTNPVKLDHGQTIPRCMDMISANSVIETMEQYIRSYP
jgi:ADP-heptose:LPS heptosyltransferase